MKNFTKAKSHRDIARVKGFDRNIINYLSQKVGEITHHDTLTGTSPRNIINLENQDLKPIYDLAGNLNS